MIAVAVRCDGNRDDGWSCSVVLREHGLDVSTHRVHVGPDDLARLARGAPAPAGLVKESFEFLLEREPPQSILRSFGLMEIGRYFPEFEAEILRRTRA
jgi:hypothetical protein